MAGWVQKGQPISQDDPRVQIYRIRDDWQEIYDPSDPDDIPEELRQDAAEFNEKLPEDVTTEEMVEIWERYRDHWQNWPVDLGAPFYDNNDNDVYEPELGEQPGLANADQVIWFVCNDQDSGKTRNFYGSYPMGIEMRATIWCYNQPFNELGQVIFKKYELINISDFQIDSMYVSQWVDPDIGVSTDDLAGCDTCAEYWLCLFRISNRSGFSDLWSTSGCRRL